MYFWLYQSVANSVGFWLMAILATLAYLQIKRKNAQNLTAKTFNLPPHVPGSLPLVGHLPFLGARPHKKLDKYKKQYGGIFSIDYGTRYAVVLSDFEVTKDTYKLDGLSERVSDILSLSEQYPTLIEMNGKEWFDHRRLASVVLRAKLGGPSLENYIQEEIARIKKLFSECDLSQDMDVRDAFTTATYNIAYSIICSKTYEVGHPVSQLLKAVSERMLRLVMIKSVLFAFKIPLSLCPYLLYPIWKSNHKFTEAILTEIGQEVTSHEKVLDPENPRDYIDYALLEQHKPAEQRKINGVNEIVGDSIVLLLTGSDTVRTGLEWASLLLARHQDAQETMYQEILKVVGSENQIKWAHHNEMPYTTAFVMETLRYKQTLPLSMLRIAPRDIVVKGFDIPKGTTIMTNLWSIQMDPTLYKDPKTFNPARFLSDDGTRALKPEHYAAYSYGNRNCLGDKMANTELFLIISSLVQSFQFLPPKAGVNMRAQMSTTMNPVYPQIRLAKRP